MLIQHRSDLPASLTLGASIVQLALDFEREMPKVARQDDLNPESEKVSVAATGFEDAHDLQPIRLQNGSYIVFAIELLLTCAEDLVIAKTILNNPRSTPERLKFARVLEKNTCDWLNAKICGQAEEHDEQSLVCPFGYQSCVEMLEEELYTQSLGQIHIPAIASRSDELAKWIQADPELAKDALGRYKTLFSEINEKESYAQALSDSFERANERPRVN